MSTDPHAKLKLKAGINNSLPVNESKSPRRWAYTAQTDLPYHFPLPPHLRIWHVSFSSLIDILAPLFLRVSEISSLVRISHVESLGKSFFPDLFCCCCWYLINLQRNKDLIPLSPDRSSESLLLLFL